MFPVKNKQKIMKIFLNKELIFIDEETLTPEELEAIADEYETEE